MADRAMKVPAIPALTPDNMIAVLEAVVQWIQTREGRYGDGLDKAATFRELGLLNLADDGNLRRVVQGRRSLAQLTTGSDTYQAPADVVPPAPTDLEARGALSSVILTWKMAPFGALDFFEVWRAPTDALGDAALVIATSAPIAADTPPSGSTFYYWVRARSIYDRVGEFNALAGTPASLALDPGLLLDALAGQITESQLYVTLAGRIDLVDAPFTVAGSVAARVKAETDARVAAIDAETDARVDAIAAEVLARSSGDTTTLNAAKTYTDSYTYSITAADAAITASANILRAEFAAADTTALNTAKAYTESWAYSKATIDSAIAASASTLTTNFTSADSATLASAQSYTSTYAYSKSAVDSALASLDSTLRTAFTSADSATLSSAQSYTNTYAYSKSAVDSAIAASASTLTTSFTSADNATLTSAQTYTSTYAYSKSAVDSALSSLDTTLRAAFAAADSSTLASANAYTYSRATIDGAIASTLSTLRAEFAAADGTTLSSAQAYTSTNAYAKSAGEALASTVSTLSTAVNSPTTGNNPTYAALQTTASTLATLDGRAGAAYTVRLQLDVSGRALAGGFGLMGNSTAAPGSEIEFGVVANRFYVGAPAATGVPAIVPFVVQTTSWSDNGVSRPPGVFMDAAYIKNLIAVYATIGSLVADDIAAAEISVAQLVAGVLRVGSYIRSSNYVPNTAGGGFNIAANGDVELNNAVVRGTIYASAGIFAGALSAATGTFAGSLSAATGTFAGNLSAAGGTFTGNLSAAGGTFAGSLSAATGTFAGNLSAAGGTFVGTIQVGSSPAVSGTTMTGTGAVINPSGTVAFGSAAKNLCFNGSELTLNGVSLVAPLMDTFSASIPSGNLTVSVAAHGATYGSRTVSASGGRAPYTYNWVLTGNTNIGVSSGATSPTVTIYGTANGVTISTAATCIVTDANGRVTTASCNVTATHAFDAGGGD